MRVVVDARPAAFPSKTGVGFYTWYLLRELPRIDPETEYVAWYLDARGLPGRRRRFDEFGAPNLTERAVPIPGRWFSPLARRFGMPRVEWFGRFDVLFAPNFIPPPTRARTLVVTVHDLAFRLFPRTAPQGTLRWLAGADRWIQQASRVIAVSEATRRDLMRLFDISPERVSVIPHGVDRTIFHPPEPGGPPELAAERFGVEGPYLLYLGGIEPRKNLPRLVEAFAGLPGDLRPALVIAGAGVEWNPEGARSLGDALGMLPKETRSRIILTGYVSQSQAAALLRGAAALVMPSLYEGFGLPVLEALACGTPVVTSNVSSLPEVAGDAAILVDPLEVDDIRTGMERILRDEELAERLCRTGPERAAGFSWERTAALTAKVLHEAAGPS